MVDTINKDDKSNKETPLSKLISIVKKNFVKSKDMNEDLLSACVNGTFVGKINESEQSSLESESPPEISADLVRFLCVHPDAVRCIDPRGIRVRNYTVQKILDLWLNFLSLLGVGPIGMTVW